MCRNKNLKYTSNYNFLDKYVQKYFQTKILINIIIKIVKIYTYTYIYKYRCAYVGMLLHSLLLNKNLTKILLIK